jgi:hypothetical protein
VCSNEKTSDVGETEQPEEERASTTGTYEAEKRALLIFRSCSLPTLSVSSTASLESNKVTT